MESTDGLRATLIPSARHHTHPSPRSPTASTSSDIESLILIDLESYHEDDNDHDQLPAFNEIDGPPPNFAPYRAEWERVDYEENIVSHDNHLNTDAEALYQFLLQQSSTPPKVYIHCKGTHFEYGSEHGHGMVTDFDFFVSLNDYIERKATHWTVADERPAYRGRCVLEVEENESSSGLRWRRREACRTERRLWREFSSHQMRQGFPPWTVKGPMVQDASRLPESFHKSETLRSSKTIRQWADQYCACKDPLKEFRLYTDGTLTLYHNPSTEQ